MYAYSLPYRVGRGSGRSYTNPKPKVENCESSQLFEFSYFNVPERKQQITVCKNTYLCVTHKEG